MRTYVPTYDASGHAVDVQPAEVSTRRRKRVGYTCEIQPLFSHAPQPIQKKRITAPIMVEMQENLRVGIKLYGAPVHACNDTFPLSRVKSMIARWEGTTAARRAKERLRSLDTLQRAEKRKARENSQACEAA